MPPAANTPRNRRKREDQHLAHIGEEGRKTGITVEERERDEAGFENPQDFFSSASKAPTTAHTSRTLRKSLASGDGSQSMDIASSPGPDVIDAISARRSRSSGPLPPQSRSPVRTNIGATPRRPPSAGVNSQSHPTPQSAGPPSSGGHARRLLDFSKGSTRSSLRSARSPPRTSLQAEETPRRGSIYDISPSPEEGRRAPMDQDDATGVLTEPDQDMLPVEVSKRSNMPSDEDIDPALDAMDVVNEEQDIAMPDMDDDDDGVLPGTVDEETEQDTSAGEEDQPAEERQLSEPDAEIIEATANTEPKRKRGRPRKSDTSLPSASKTKPTKAKAPAAKKGRPGRPPMAEKDRNKKIAKPGFKKPYIPGIPHPLQRPRDETPYEDDNDENLRTRSGRISYKPLATWKNERAVFEVVAGPKGVPLNSVTNIIRMDEVTPVKRRHGPVAGSKLRRKRQKKALQDGSQDDSQLEAETEPDPEEQPEPWEELECVIQGLVRAWDSEIECGTNEAIEEDIATAAKGIEMHANEEGSFSFAKTLTTPFFGCGVVEVPPQGFKRRKNAGKMHMMFFVHTGKVVVEVAETSFTISKGGVWQVPRGNNYSIENFTSKPATVFFAQGREVDLMVAADPSELRQEVRLPAES